VRHIWCEHRQEGEQNNEQNKDTGPEAGVKGIVEDVKGKAKEAVGAIPGRMSYDAREGHSRRRRRPNGTWPRRGPRPRRLVPKPTLMRLAEQRSPQS
jgi:hypothetical protein